MDFQDVKPAHKQVMIAQQQPAQLEFQAITGDLGKIDRLPVLQGWMLGYTHLPETEWHNPKLGQKMTLVRRMNKPHPDIYLFEHKPAPVPEWNAFKKLLVTDLDKLNPEQIQQVSTILGTYGTPSCQVRWMQLGGRTGLIALKLTNDHDILAQAFFFASDPAHRIIEEVGQNFTAASTQEKHDLEEMFGRIKFVPENAKRDAEPAVR